MDINTPKGQQTLKEEQFMLSKFEIIWKCDAIQTNKNKGAACDGIFLRKKEIKGVFESKCRHLTVDQLEDYGSWLISFEKIEKGRLLSKLLQVPYYGLLYLVDDNVIMYWEITDDDGNYVFKFETETRETQYCVNGGSKIDKVALLPIKNGKYLRNT
jgi:hypothetical protein